MAPRAAAPGPLLGGRYRLQEVVGRGATADVHRGWDTRLDRSVAVKVARAGSDLPNGSAEMTAEARRMALLAHPGLVAVHDLGVVDGRPFVVMDLVQGSTLSALLAERPERRLALEDVRALAADLADALAAVHAAGLVHRDIKPANILVEPHGDRLHPRLTDFGIARMVGATRQTATGLTVGTAPYLAPEQVLGSSVTGATDVYALGLVLLECVTGRVEYPGSAVEAAVARLHRAPEVPLDLPDTDRELLAAMLAHDPGERPPADQVALRWRGQRPTPAPRDEQPAEVVARTSTRRRGAPVAVPVARPGTASAAPAAPARRRAPLPLGRRRRQVRLTLVALALTAGGAVAGTALRPAPEVPPLPAPPVQGPTGDALRDLHTAVSG
jgi:serine/threonine protein kinase